MHTKADLAITGLAGAGVVVAVLLFIWVARDSSAGSAGSAPGPSAREDLPRGLYSARAHRAPVTRTAITVEQQRARKTHDAVPAATR